MKKLLCVFLSVIMILTVCTVSFSAFATDETKTYPFVFIHGMFGWGEAAEERKGQSYWGYSSERCIIEDMQNLGYEACSVTVGPVSSAWDRACETYAQIAGTVVDYGEAHSNQHNHERYGRDYTGKSLLAKPFDVNTDKVSLVTHSFGGPTSIVLASMLENGVQEEIEVSGENVSPLFEGGHAGAIFSITALASPTNGTPLANIMHDTIAPMYAFALILNMQAISGKDDPMLDQFGISVDPESGEKAKLNLKGVKTLASGKDNCAYDMTIRGARELNERFPVAKETYLFSHVADVTEKDAFGVYRPSPKSNAIMIAGATGVDITLGMKIDGVKITKEWTQCDGLVPAVSASHPFNSDSYADYTEGMDVEKGVWYVMPVTQHKSGHGYHVSYGTSEEKTAELENFYKMLGNRISALK